VQATGVPVQVVGELVDGLRADGHDVAIRDVPDEFPRGARTMLVFRRDGAAARGPPPARPGNGMARP
jgi:hypothetical protein